MFVACRDYRNINTYGRINVKSTCNMKHIINLQQTNTVNDVNLLNCAIKKGMTNFAEQLLSGSATKKKRHLKKVTNNIPDHSKNMEDMGHLIGYQICQSYFETATDKNQAMHDMLDYNEKFRNLAYGA